MMMGEIDQGVIERSNTLSIMMVGQQDDFDDAIIWVIGVIK